MAFPSRLDGLPQRTDFYKHEKSYFAFPGSA
jgi:hypothetical protein